MHESTFALFVLTQHSTMMFPNMLFHLVLSINLSRAPWSFTNKPSRRDVLGSNVADQVLLALEGTCGGTVCPFAM